MSSTKVQAKAADNRCMDITSIAARGLSQADAQLNSAGSKIAASSVKTSNGAGKDTVDLSSAVVDLLAAKNLYSVNIKTIKAADEIQMTIIDLLG
jgi:flagellar hook protein FlgE